MVDAEQRNLIEHMKTWVIQAGQRIEKARDSGISYREKTSLRDLVTPIELEIENFYRVAIKKVYPTHKILGEEKQGEQAKSLQGSVWIMDPIDGTLNYIKQADNYVTMLSYFKNGVGQVGMIYEVSAKKLLIAIKGKGVFVNGHFIKPIGKQTCLAQSLMSVEALDLNDALSLYEFSQKSLGLRITGCAGLDAWQFALGQTGLYLNHLFPWDNAVSVIMADLLGFKVTNFKGESLNLLDREYVVMAYPKIHEEFLTYVKEKFED